MNPNFADLLFAASENEADLRYLSGFGAPDPFLYFRIAGQGHIVVSDLEYDRAMRERRRDVHVHNQTEFGPLPASAAMLACSIARQFHLAGFRVPYTFPAGLAVELRKNGLEIDIVRSAFAPERGSKTESEIAEIRKAIRIAEAGLQAALELIGAASVNAEGILEIGGSILTCEQLRGAIDGAMAARDAVGSGTIAAAGKAAAQPHNRGEGAIHAGDPIVMDIFPRLNGSGYWGDLTRTVVKGKASPIVRRAFEAVREARDRAEERIHAGLTGASIHEFAAAILKKAGFPTGSGPQGNYGFFHGLGHGVGLEIHEAPRLSPSGTKPLAAGAVVTVEPGLYDPAWGGIRLEDVVVVREDHAEKLTAVETFLEME